LKKKTLYKETHTTRKDFKRFKAVKCGLMVLYHEI